MKKLKINHKSLKDLEKDIESYDPDFLTGEIKDIKKLDLTQESEVLGKPIKPEPEIIDVSNFKDRKELDEYVYELLGDNLTLNRMNSHRLKGSKAELDKLSLSLACNIYGVKVIYD